jgi:hypothetical protein
MATAELEMPVDFVTQELAYKYSDVTVSIVRITPDIARRMLEKNTKNRNMNKKHAERFRDAMAVGEWWMNGETIILSSSGVLLNGQHRLWAIIASGVEVDVLVVRGIDEDAFKTIDSVRARKAGEVLAIAGEPNANKIASCVQAVLAFVDTGGNPNGSTNHARRATPQTCERVLQANPGIRESVRQMSRNVVFNNQHSHMLHYVFSHASQKLAQAFADVMAEGDADIGRPFVVLRESFLRVPCRSDLRRSYIVKAIKAFNAEVAGERPKMFKFLAEEECPAISGLDYERFAELVG